MVVGHQPPLITRLLLHKLLSIDNIYTLRQVFHFSVELHAANRIDALLGSERICRNVFDGRRGFLNHHLARYHLSVEYYSLLIRIERCTRRLGDGTAIPTPPGPVPLVLTVQFSMMRSVWLIKIA